VWKGAISFGLVNIPVSLYPGTRAKELSFDLIDKRDFSPIGYQRINKRTGDVVAWDDIVKGYEYEDGRYVVMTDADFRQANPKATQTVDIFAFVDGASIPPYYFDRPYYLEPGKRAEKGYALLRETLARTAKVGLANVVIRTRQHIAALIPVGPALVLDTLRFADELVPAKSFDLPGEATAKAGVSERELAMAERLVADMSEAFEPERYRDTYRDDLMARIEHKVRTNETHVVTQPGREAEPGAGAEIIDLVAMLRKSLESRGKGRTLDQEKPPRRGTKAARDANGEDGATKSAHEEEGAHGEARSAHGRVKAAHRGMKVARGDTNAAHVDTKGARRTGTGGRTRRS
jgi:DNA end-binding protein Ku